MNVLFLNPPFKGRFSRASRSPAVPKGGTLYYPIWLAYAAGVLEQDGCSIRLIDAPASRLSLKDVFDRLGKFVPRLIVLATSTPSLDSDIKIGEALKTRFPDSLLVAVGTHVSALPEDSLEHSPALDAVARREYDFTVREIARRLRDGDDWRNVTGLSLRRGQSIVHNPDRPLIEDLDSVPFVSQVYKRHLNIADYFFAAARSPMVMLITGRGCPHTCAFCVYPQTFHGRRYRTRSPENVAAEFHWIRERWPQIREIGIEDDTFTGDRDRARRIAELLIQENNRLKWYCNVRPDVDFDTLSLMKKAGCRLVTVGFESGNQAMLDSMHKGITVEQIKRFRKDAGRAGLLVHGCFVFGFPGETTGTIQDSLDLANELNCDSLQFYPLYVYPGTESYSKAQELEHLTTTDFSCWVTEDGFHNCVISQPGLSAADLVDICDKALRNYHFRPRYLLRKLIQALRHPGEGMRTSRAAVAYLRSLGPRTRHIAPRKD